MKILLLEEYSGFFKNLKEGLVANGHEVLFIATQDRWKKIDGMDIIISSRYGGLIGKIVRRFKILFYMRHMKGFDVVFLINQSFLLQGISTFMLWFLKRNNKRFFLSACGGDVQYIDYGLNSGYRAWPYDGCLQEATKIYKKPHHKRLNANVASVVDGVIPVTYEYAEAWRNSKYKELLLPTIPLPMNTDVVKMSSQNFKKKIIFFHGLSRECFKGTIHIVKAMKNMKEKYPEDIEIIIDGRMPLKDYLKLLDRVNVVIDGCKGYTYSSMNSLYSMALGKIVMIPAEKECIDEFQLKEDPPVIHTSANSEFIERQMEFLVHNNRDKLKEMSIKSRRFVKEIHGHRLIADKYVKAWSNFF
jgi:hypothetical protein